MAHTYTSSGYGHQTYWSASTAMARNTSHDSNYSNYSESSNGQYEVALSPGSEVIGSYDFFSASNRGTSYTVDGQGYDTRNQAEDSEFQFFQFYDFITAGESGEGPYWRLKSGFTATTEYPETMAVTPSAEVPRSANDASGRHVCLEPLCNASPFRRKADLQRHYLHRHRDVTQKKPFPCDWKKCQRSKEPFYRLDHCREHYRDYHNEDILRRGSHKETKEWWKNRNVDSKWWRCAKCLSRISIDSNGFECAKCKTACEPERQRLRGY